MEYILGIFILLGAFCFLLILKKYQLEQKIIEGNAIIYVISPKDLPQKTGMFLDGQLEDGTYIIKCFTKNTYEVPKEIKLENCRFYLLDKEIIFWEYIRGGEDQWDNF